VNDVARSSLDERNRFLVELDDATRPLERPEDITQTAARLLGRHLKVNRCAYADVEADQDTFNLTGDFNAGVPSIVGRYAFTRFGAECLRLMRAGLPFVVTDSEVDPRLAEVRETYRPTRIRALVCVPIIKSGRFVASIAVHQIGPREWRPDEIELVQRVASRCWESIERARVTRELRESERRLRLAQRAARLGAFEWEIPTGRMHWSPELELLYGLDAGTFEGRFEDWLRRIVEEDELRAHARAPTQSAALDGSITLHGVRVMMVDDEADARNLVRRLLEDHGAHVVTAASGGKRFRSSRPRSSTC
jgi:GAF domain-containing protein